MTKVALLINETAGRGRFSAQGRQAVAEFQRLGIDVAVPEVSSAAELAAVSRDLVAAGYDAIVAVGGDGTVSQVANAVARTGVGLGIIPVGTGNDAARFFGIAIDDVPTVVARIVAALRAAPRLIDLVEVTPGGAYPTGHGKSQFYLGVASAGLDAVINARSNAMLRPKGPLRYIIAAITEILRFQPYGYQLEFNGKRVQLRGTLVSAANLPYVGGGMKLIPGAEPEDGLLDLFYAPQVSRFTIIRLFARIFRGTHMRHPAISVVRTSVVDITHSSAHGAAVPVLFADGEPLATVPVRLEVARGALRILA